MIKKSITEENLRGLIEKPVESLNMKSRDEIEEILLRNYFQYLNFNSTFIADLVNNLPSLLTCKEDENFTGKKLHTCLLITNKDTEILRILSKSKLIQKNILMHLDLLIGKITISYNGILVLRIFNILSKRSILEEKHLPLINSQLEKLLYEIKQKIIDLSKKYVESDYTLLEPINQKKGEKRVKLSKRYSVNEEEFNEKLAVESELRIYFTFLLEIISTCSGIFNYNIYSLIDNFLVEYISIENMKNNDSLVIMQIDAICKIIRTLCLSDFYENIKIDRMERLKIFVEYILSINEYLIAQRNIVYNLILILESNEKNHSFILNLIQRAIQPKNFFNLQLNDMKEQFLYIKLAFGIVNRLNPNDIIVLINNMHYIIINSISKKTIEENSVPEDIIPLKIFKIPIFKFDMNGTYKHNTINIDQFKQIILTLCDIIAAGNIKNKGTYYIQLMKLIYYVMCDCVERFKSDMDEITINIHNLNILFTLFSTLLSFLNTNSKYQSFCIKNLNVYQVNVFYLFYVKALEIIVYGFEYFYEDEHQILENQQIFLNYLMVIVHTLLYLDPLYIRYILERLINNNLILSYSILIFIQLLLKIPSMNAIAHDILSVAFINEMKKIFKNDEHIVNMEGDGGPYNTFYIYLMHSLVNNEHFRAGDNTNTFYRKLVQLIDLCEKERPLYFKILNILVSSGETCVCNKKEKNILNEYFSLYTSNIRKYISGNYFILPCNNKKFRITIILLNNFIVNVKNILLKEYNIAEDFDKIIISGRFLYEESPILFINFVGNLFFMSLKNPKNYIIDRIMHKLYVMPVISYNNLYIYFYQRAIVLGCLQYVIFNSEKTFASCVYTGNKHDLFIRNMDKSEIAQDKIDNFKGDFGESQKIINESINYKIRVYLNENHKYYEELLSHTIKKHIYKYGDMSELIVKMNSGYRKTKFTYFKRTRLLLAIYKIYPIRYYNKYKKFYIEKWHGEDSMFLKYNMRNKEVLIEFIKDQFLKKDLRQEVIYYTIDALLFNGEKEFVLDYMNTLEYKKLCNSRKSLTNRVINNIFLRNLNIFSFNDIIKKICLTSFIFTINRKINKNNLETNENIVEFLYKLARQKIFKCPFCNIKLNRRTLIILLKSLFQLYRTDIYNKLYLNIIINQYFNEILKIFSTDLKTAVEFEKIYFREKHNLEVNFYRKDNNRPIIIKKGELKYFYRLLSMIYNNFYKIYNIAIICLEKISIYFQLNLSTLIEIYTHYIITSDSNNINTYNKNNIYLYVKLTEYINLFNDSHIPQFLKVLKNYLNTDIKYFFKNNFIHYELCFIEKNINDITPDSFVQLIRLISRSTDMMTIETASEFLNILFLSIKSIYCKSCTATDTGCIAKNGLHILSEANFNSYILLLLAKFPQLQENVDNFCFKIITMIQEKKLEFEILSEISILRPEIWEEKVNGNKTLRFGIIEFFYLFDDKYYKNIVMQKAKQNDLLNINTLKKIYRLSLRLANNKLSFFKIIKAGRKYLFSDYHLKESTFKNSNLLELIFDLFNDQPDAATDLLNEFKNISKKNSQTYTAYLKTLFNDLSSIKNMNLKLFVLKELNPSNYKNHLDELLLQMNKVDFSANVLFISEKIILSNAIIITSLLDSKYNNQSVKKTDIEKYYKYYYSMFVEKEVYDRVMYDYLIPSNKIFATLSKVKYNGDNNCIVDKYLFKFSHKFFNETIEELKVLDCYNKIDREYFTDLLNIDFNLPRVIEMYREYEYDFELSKNNLINLIDHAFRLLTSSNGSHRLDGLNIGNIIVRNENIAYSDRKIIYTLIFTSIVTEKDNRHIKKIAIDEYFVDNVDLDLTAITLKDDMINKEYLLAFIKYELLKSNNGDNQYKTNFLKYLDTILITIFTEKTTVDYNFIRILPSEYLGRLFMNFRATNTNDLHNHQNFILIYIALVEGVVYNSCIKNIPEYNLEKPWALNYFTDMSDKFYVESNIFDCCSSLILHVFYKFLQKDSIFYSNISLDTSTNEFYRIMRLDKIEYLDLDDVTCTCNKLIDKGLIKSYLNLYRVNEPIIEKTFCKCDEYFLYNFFDGNNIYVNLLFLNSKCDQLLEDVYKKLENYTSEEFLSYYLKFVEINGEEKTFIKLLNLKRKVTVMSSIVKNAMFEYLQVLYSKANIYLINEFWYMKYRHCNNKNRINNIIFQYNSNYIPIQYIGQFVKTGNNTILAIYLRIKQLTDLHNINNMINLNTFHKPLEKYINDIYYNEDLYYSALRKKLWKYKKSDLFINMQFGDLTKAFDAILNEFEQINFSEDIFTSCDTHSENIIYLLKIFHRLNEKLSNYQLCDKITKQIKNLDTGDKIINELIREEVFEYCEGITAVVQKKKTMDLKETVFKKIYKYDTIDTVPVYNYTTFESVENIKFNTKLSFTYLQTHSPSTTNYLNLWSKYTLGANFSTNLQLQNLKNITLNSYTTVVSNNLIWSLFIPYYSQMLVSINLKNVNIKPNLLIAMAINMTLNGHLERGMAFIKKMLDNNSVDIEIVFKRFSMEFEIFNLLEYKKGIKIFSISNINYFKDIQKSNFFMLSGNNYKKRYLRTKDIRFAEESDKFYKVSLLLGFNCRSHYEYGELLYNAYKETGKESYKRKAFISFLHSSNSYLYAKESIVYLFDLFSDAYFGIFQQLILNINLNHFLFFVPQLISSISHINDDIIRQYKKYKDGEDIKEDTRTFCQLFLLLNISGMECSSILFQYNFYDLFANSELIKRGHTVFFNEYKYITDLINKNVSAKNTVKEDYYVYLNIIESHLKQMDISDVDIMHQLDQNPVNRAYIEKYNLKGNIVERLESMYNLVQEQENTYEKKKYIINKNFSIPFFYDRYTSKFNLPQKIYSIVLLRTPTFKIIDQTGNIINYKFIRTQGYDMNKIFYLRHFQSIINTKDIQSENFQNKFNRIALLQRNLNINTHSFHKNSNLIFSHTIEGKRLRDIYGKKRAEKNRLIFFKCFLEYLIRLKGRGQTTYNFFKVLNRFCKKFGNSSLKEFFIRNNRNIVDYLYYKNKFFENYSSNMISNYIVGLLDSRSFDMRINISGDFDYNILADSIGCNDITMAQIRYSPTFSDLFSRVKMDGVFRSFAYHISEEMKTQYKLFSFYQLENEALKNRLDKVSDKNCEVFIENVMEQVYKMNYDLKDYPFI